MLKNQCWMLTQPEEGGGNVSTSASITVRRSAAIGDALAASVVADKLSEQGFECNFQTHVNIHCVLRRQPNVARLYPPDGFAHVDLDGCYERNPARRNLHFYEMFLATANNTLRGYGITLSTKNCNPRLVLDIPTKQAALAKFNDYPRPWIFLVPRSNSYLVRQVPDAVWEPAAAKMPGTKFWLGTHPAPAGIVDLQCRHLDNLMAWFSAADLIVSVDTGPLHIAAALGKQLVALGQSSSPELHLSDQCDFETLWPAEKLDCLNCQQNICHKSRYTPPCQNFNAEHIAATVTRKWNGRQEHAVSAIISIYRPEASVLNRCLQQVVPQAQEVILCSDQAGIMPSGVVLHGKVREVRSRLFDIGYGRKQNFAARHSNGEYLLLLNDDVFLDPEAVARMREVMESDPKVGMVSNLLRYPDGTIYHAGKTRTPGMKGWAHLNLKQHLPDLREVTELENCCGACVLVRREAFYQMSGFDEEFYLYAEDDDFALRIRKNGWKIMFTPHSTGIHLEHQSTSKTGPIVQHLNNSNKVFGRKWGRYLEYNSNRIPGNFDYMKA